MKKVAIIPNPLKSHAVDLVGRIVRQLLERDFIPVLEEEIAEKIGEPVLGRKESTLWDGIDLAMVLGGDGSMLNVAHRVYPREIPLLGVNLGHLAIKNLIIYIIGMNGIVGIFSIMGYPVTETLTLIPNLVIQGQWWRLLTFVFIPPTVSIFWLFFILYFYYMIGTTLEEEWGSFYFNLYYLLGICGTALGSFLTGTEGTPIYLNLSLFLAFARIYPDYELLLFFILPVKIKYLAWFNWFYIGYTVLFMPMAFKVAAIVSIVNYFIFFGKEIFTHSRERQRVHHNRQKFYNQIPQHQSIHKCVICGKTENDDPKLEFRYCAKCAGDYEYCMEHLENHDHVQANPK